MQQLAVEQQRGSPKPNIYVASDLEMLFFTFAHASTDLSPSTNHFRSTHGGEGGCMASKISMTISLQASLCVCSFFSEQILYAFSFIKRSPVFSIRAMAPESPTKQTNKEQINMMAGITQKAFSLIIFEFYLEVAEEVVIFYYEMHRY
jgi:hypothetical protein